MMDLEQIYTNEDCMEVMARYPDGYFDLAIVDPPYGIGAANSSGIRHGKQHGKSLCVSGIRYNPKEWDSNKPDRGYFEELFRVSKNQIIWGANHFGGMPPSAGWIVWDKENGENQYSDCELAFSSIKGSVKKFLFKWHGMLQGNMKNKEPRIHPTQKPVALYRWLLQNYAKPGDRILDTHVGSASSLIAFEEYGHPYVACELDADYYRDSCKRLENARSQMRLFMPNGDITPEAQQTKLF